jgi:ribosomal-protein-alanine N-acetyltransferase
VRTDERYRIRRASPADLPRIADIERAVFSDPWPAAAFRDLLGIEALVAASPAGQVVGYLFAHHAADEGEILNLAVDPAHSRCGVGTALVQTVLRDLGDAGVARVFLEVRESNRPAQAFYQILGFTPVSRRPRYYSRPREDALVLMYEIWHGTGLA